MREAKNIILFGYPRSGTTWLSEILSYENDIELIHEPDNELISFLGFYYKINLSRFPYLNENHNNKDFYALYDNVLSKKIKDHKTKTNALLYYVYNLSKSKIQENLNKYNKPAPKKLPLSDIAVKLLISGKDNHRKLIKTVHSILALPFLLKNFEFTPVVIQRNPLSVFSSYLKLNMNDRNRRIYTKKSLIKDYGISTPNIQKENRNVRTGFQIAVFDKAIERYRQEYHDIIFVKYEDLLTDTLDKIEDICDNLSIDYTYDMGKLIKSKMKPGAGYTTNRDPKAQFDIWQKRLTTEQIDDFLKGYSMIHDEINFLH